MGKTPKPLNICPLGELVSWPEIQALFGQGHGWVADPDEADLVLGPMCHRMDDSLRKWLPEAIQEAQRRKYPSKKGSE